MKLALYLPNFRDKVTVKELEDLTALAEELDFDSVWTLDRIVVPEASDRQELRYSFGMMDEFPKALPVSARGEWYQGWPLIPWLAAKTTKVRIGMSITDTPYRAPGVLATEIATIDHLSNGRVILGLGVSGPQVVASQIKDPEFDQCVKTVIGGLHIGSAPNAKVEVSYPLAFSRVRAAREMLLGIAAAVGPLLGGFITTYLSWRVGFLLEAVIIAIVLALLTAGEVTVSYAHMARGLQILLLLSMMAVKFALVVLFFMHLRYSTRLTWVVAGAGLFWLGIRARKSGALS